MPVLKLERLDDKTGLPFTDIEYVWLNSDRIEAFFRAKTVAAVSSVTMAGGGRILVRIDPDDLAVLIDPEHACSSGDRCLYVTQYLARGPAELPHGGFHAAERAAERHAEDCTYTERTNEPCPSCATHEARLRV